jgi:rhamnosyltransferase
LILHDRPGVRICAIVVTYFPNLDQVERLVGALTKSIANTVVVDNGSTDDLAPLVVQYPALRLEKLHENKGIATAQNHGIRAARHLGATHVLFLDQDSIPDAEMVPRLLRALQELQDGGVKVGCVGPEIRHSQDGPSARFASLGRPKVRGKDPAADDVLECLFVISSGSLVPMPVLEDVGNMEDTLFIDVVDEEWCLRARGKGYRIFGVRGAGLNHRLGDSARMIWLGRARRAPRHKPFRYYYIFRNTIAVAGRKYTPLRWVVFRLALLVKLFLFYGIFASPRGGELSAMAKGIFHGLRGVTGKSSIH